MISLDQLEAFVQVARNGSLTAAARVLGVTQPSLTRRLAALEASLGAPLFVRTRAGVVPTDAGERFLEHAVRALASVSAGREAVAEARGELRGVVSVGAIPTVGAYLLPDVLAEFWRAHAGVRLRLREGWPSEMEDSLARGELDLAVVNMPLRRADLVVRRLFTEDYVLAAHESHRFTARASVPLDEIAREPLLVVPISPATRALAALAEQRGFALQVVAESDNHEALRRMVERGLGVSLFPRLLAEGASRRPTRVRYVDVAAGVVRRRIVLAHHGGAYLGAAARALRDAIVARAAKVHAARER